jgi:hypothetical protein
MSSKESRATALGIAPEAARVLANHNVATGLTATGSAITDALDLAAEFNLVATTAASTGVQLPDWPIGSVIYVRNDGANSLNVFPHSATGTINAGGGGAAQAVATTKKGRFIRLTALNWDYTLEN